jgi:anti-sigma factor RsiW
VLERQDIDALLVSALYEELTPADEARLAMHLESHPGDRTALDDLKVARTAVRESRIFELQLDPPQAVSALLLQEAARRAPKSVPRRDDAKAESWFQRFVRSFIAHPAMAAAATLVLVVGVAGTIYLKNGSMKVAQPTMVAQDEPAPAAAAGAGSAASELDHSAVAVAGDAGIAAVSAGDDQVRVDLATNTDKADEKKLGIADNDRGRAIDNRKQQVAQHAAATGTVAGPSRNGSFGYDGKGGKDAVAAYKTDPAAKPTSPPTATTKDARRYVEVHTDQPSVKELPDTTTETVAKGEAPNNPHAGATPGGGGGASGAAAPQQPRTSVAASPPPPPVAIPAESQKPKPADKAPTPNKEDVAFAWAKDQHAQVIALVKAGKCRDAAPLAVGIKNRAPDYYNSYVVPDRQIKQCMQYINDAAEKDAERSAKSRPAKRADLKEPSPAPAADTHK